VHAGDAKHDVHHRDRQHRPDGIDEDGFAFEHRLDAPWNRDAAQQRLNHGRSGDRDERTEHDRNREGEAGDEPHGECGTDPCNENADRDEIAHFRQRALQVAQTQAQRPFEQDDRDRQLDDDAEAVA
jgi:hypothetical protein